MQLQPHGIGGEAATGRAAPDDRVLPLLYVLLRRTRLIVEQRHRFGRLVILVTSNPTRGYNSRGDDLTSATTRRALFHEAT